MARRITVYDCCETELFSDDMFEGRNGFVMWQEEHSGVCFTVVAQANDEDGEMLEMAFEIPNCGRRLE